MRYLFSIAILFCALFADAQIERYGQLPEEIQQEVNRKAMRQARRAFEQAQEEGGEIVIPPIERIIVDPSPVIQNYSGDVLPVDSWGRQVVFPEGLRQRVISECGKYKVIVGIVDSGVDTKHKNLKGDHWLESSNYSGDPAQHWHGTHVAGIVWQMVAATVQNSGNIFLKDIQILRSNGSGSFAAAANMANSETSLLLGEIEKGTGVILNNSWGYNGPAVGIFETALSKSAAKGLIWVASAGNSGREGPGYPGTSDYTVSIASLQQAGLKRSPFSTMNDKVDVAMPGSLINSTLPGDRQGKASGTSMSAPFTSGLAALAYGKYGPVLQGSNMAAYLRHIATDLPPDGKDIQTGYGIKYIVQMLDTDPCDVPGICDDDNPDNPEGPEDDPEEPNDPDDPEAANSVTFEGSDYVIRWQRQGESGFRILLIKGITVQGTGPGDAAQVYDEIKQFVDQYPNNRAIVVTPEMGYTDATWWYGQFMEYEARRKGISLQVELVKGQDEQGRQSIARDFDRAATNSTPVRLESVSLDAVAQRDDGKRAWLVRAMWAKKNKVGSRAVPITEFDDFAGVHYTYIVTDGQEPTKEMVQKSPPFRGAIIKEILSLIPR